MPNNDYRDRGGFKMQLEGDDYRDIAARHHVDCVCADCERAQYEEQCQRQRIDVYRQIGQQSAAQYGYINESLPTWDDLVTWLVANPCASNQDLATKLLAAFVMRRIA